MTTALPRVLLPVSAGLGFVSAARAENPIVPAGAKLELLHTRQVKLNSGLTEGPAVAADGTVYFTDVPFGTGGGMILRFDPKSGKVSVFTDRAFKSDGLAFDAAGNLISCDGADGGGRCLRRWDLKTGKSVLHADRYQGKRFNSPNDLCVDSKGRIYFTDPRYGGTEPRGLRREAVYRLDADGTVVEITRDVEKPNGLTLSPDQKTLYVGDHNNGGSRLSPEDPEPKRGAMKVYALPLDAGGLVAGGAEDARGLRPGERLRRRAGGRRRQHLPGGAQPGPARDPGGRPRGPGTRLHPDRAREPERPVRGLEGRSEQRRVRRRRRRPHALRHRRQEPVSHTPQDPRRPPARGGQVTCCSPSAGRGGARVRE
ncbi:MAG: SMP-30/gluconolactonase/LRE family protein [Gemmataceae bacterium]|nr:SMP-30/gluconolactonase/LRE family protein [Gemmataceae bacterium]